MDMELGEDVRSRMPNPALAPSSPRSHRKHAMRASAYFAEAGQLSGRSSTSKRAREKQKQCMWTSNKEDETNGSGVAYDMAPAFTGCAKCVKIQSAAATHP
eukprot:1153558-Pelagomonas_calceolata.AAC.4